MPIFSVDDSVWMFFRNTLGLHYAAGSTEVKTVQTHCDMLANMWTEV